MDTDNTPKKSSKLLTISKILVGLTALSLISSYFIYNTICVGICRLINNFSIEHLFAFSLVLIGYNIFNLVGIIIAYFVLQKYKNPVAKKVIFAGFIVFFISIFVQI